MWLLEVYHCTKQKKNTLRVFWMCCAHTRGMKKPCSSFHHAFCTAFLCPWHSKNLVPISRDHMNCTRSFFSHQNAFVFQHIYILKQVDCSKTDDKIPKTPTKTDDTQQTSIFFMIQIEQVTAPNKYCICALSLSFNKRI